MDKALDEVRPYLIADGGNVEVAAVQDGVVMLRLQGACGTCPSSTATMKMGIERSLRVRLLVLLHLQGKGALRDLQGKATSCSLSITRVGIERSLRP